MTPDPTGRHAVVGRAAELDELMATLDRAAGGASKGTPVTETDSQTPRSPRLRTVAGPFRLAAIGVPAGRS